MVDLAALKENYLLLATCEAGDALLARRAWLFSQFRSLSGEVDEVSSISIGGRSTSMVFRGSTPEQRLTAVRKAIEYIDAMLAGSQPAGALFGVRLNFPPLTPN